MTSKKRLNILLADDGSQHAQSAVEFLQAILPPASKITAARAFTPGQVTSLPGFEKSQERTKSQLEGAGFKVETILEMGSPAEKILELAEQRHPHLIVVGAKGLRATLGILLGGVAQQVVEYACCPVLVVRAPFLGLKRILLVTDGSPHSQRAARALLRFPHPDDVEARVMHVLPPEEQPVMMEPYFGGWQTAYAIRSPEETTARLAAQQKQGEALLTRTVNLLARHGLESTPILVRGDAATEILNYVRENQIDLIVAGSRGLSQFKSFWVGSVSRKLVHYAPCSVLIVKGTEKEKTHGS
jgi:nucleotide-binding universal stress UspA family protein